MDNARGLQGFEVTENAMGFTAVRLHYSADPDKDIFHPDDPIRKAAQEWYDRTRRLFSDPNTWAQEMEINWWVAAGTRVFPQFIESLHVKPLEFRARKVLYRAWDFGWHAPACLLAQIDSKDRLVVLKEIVGHQETTRQFAQRVLNRCTEWFPYHTAGVQDFCDPAGQQARPVESEKNEMRDVEILNGLSIFPSWEYGWSRKDGTALVHQLLRLRTDETPSLYVEASGCPTLVQGFLGKYVYPESRTGKIQDEPVKGLHPWGDVMDCLRYLCTGLYSALGLRRFKYQPVLADPPTFHGYGTPTSRHTRTVTAEWPQASQDQGSMDRHHAAWQQIGRANARD